MHPYQDQINRMWELIRQESKARKNGSWIEAINLSYILMEIELKVLLTSKAGKDMKPLSVGQINEAGDLMSLANLAKKNEFIDDILFSKINDFNENRHKSTKLEETANSTIGIIQEIQNKFLTISFG